jgi:hypothetical protein
LCRPKEQRSNECSEEQSCGEVRDQSRCVFQALNVRWRTDAQSTHMDGEG